MVILFSKYPPIYHWTTCRQFGAISDFSFHLRFVWELCGSLCMIAQLCIELAFKIQHNNQGEAIIIGIPVDFPGSVVFYRSAYSGIVLLSSIKHIERRRTEQFLLLIYYDSR